jgi:HSP20 family protein
MAMKDLIPWNRKHQLGARGGMDPFTSFRQEMDRLFDDTFRGFALTPFWGKDGMAGLEAGWPSIEVTETEKEIKVTAEVPGLDEKAVEVTLANGMLCITGEKKEETEDKERRFSERFYGRFERRIPVEDVDESKAAATFKDGVLTVVLEKMPGATEKVKRIPIKH